MKVYESRKRQNIGGGWGHEMITLRPDTSAAGFEPIVVSAESTEEVRIVAELVAVLPDR